MRARCSLHDRAPRHELVCFVGTIQQQAHAARAVHGGWRKQIQTYGLEIMGTELVIVGVTFAFFGLCALFVRICDRI
jgi:hypothetical protein